MSIAKQIFNKRKVLKLSQKELAKKIGIARETISKLETGKLKKPPSEDLLRKIAEALGEKVSYLFEEEPKSTIPTTQKLPLIAIQLHVEPQHIEMVEKVIKRLVEEFRKEKSKSDRHL